MAKRLRFFEFALLVGAASVIVFHMAGCGGTAPVAASGRVTLDGKPLNEAVILFVPLDAGRKKTGAEILEGNYQLPSDIGLLPGKYRVDIADNPPLLSAAHSQSRRPAAAVRRSFPSRYSHDSPFTIEYVPDGITTFDFELTTAPSTNRPTTAERSSP